MKQTGTVNEATNLQCRNCGFMGTDSEPVEYTLGYVGGRGYTRTGPFCRNVVACWYRWDDGARGAAWSKMEVTA